MRHGPRDHPVRSLSVKDKAIKIWQRPLATYPGDSRASRYCSKDERRRSGLAVGVPGSVAYCPRPRQTPDPGRGCQPDDDVEIGDRGDSGAGPPGGEGSG